jgi:hypothetical protein
MFATCKQFILSLRFEELLQRHRFSSLSMFYPDEQQLFYRTREEISKPLKSMLFNFHFSLS